MKPRSIALAIAAGATLFAAAPAFAHQPYDAPTYGNGYGYGHGYGHGHGHGYGNGYGRYRHHYYRPRPVVVYEPAPSYYYAPPRPVYYDEPPRYYYEPRQEIYGRIPIGDARVGFRIGF